MLSSVERATKSFRLLVLCVFLFVINVQSDDSRFNQRPMRYRLIYKSDPPTYYYPNSLPAEIKNETILTLDPSSYYFANFSTVTNEAVSTTSTPLDFSTSSTEISRKKPTATTNNLLENISIVMLFVFIVIIIIVFCKCFHSERLLHFCNDYYSF